MDTRSSREIMVDRWESLIVETLGYEEAFKELVKTMSSQQKEDHYSYIMRMNDIRDREEGNK